MNPTSEPSEGEAGRDGDIAATDAADHEDMRQAPAQPSFASRNRTLVVLAAIAAAVLVGVLAVVVAVLTGPANSTSNVRVVTPAPASAAGLSRDHADESSPQFQAGLTLFRRRYATSVHERISSYATAIYTNAPPGTRPAGSATVGVVYLGFNFTGAPLVPADTVRAAIGGLTSNVHVSSTLSVHGLPGDTSAQCLGSTQNGRSTAACVWATDHTVSVLISLLPATPAELATLLKKLQPILDRG